MNERLSKQILSEARRSMEPSKADQEAVLRRVMMTAAAASAAGTAAAAAEASGTGSLTAGWLKGTTLIKLGAAFLVLSGGAVLWSTLRAGREPSPPPNAARHVASASLATDAEPTPSAPVATRSTTFFEPVASSPEDDRDANATARVEAGEVVAPDAQNPHRAKHRRAPSHHPVEAPSASLETVSDPEDSLYLEISAMKRASAALRDGHPPKAIRILDDFERAATAGVMQQERDAIRVLALCAMGPSKTAEEASLRFLRRSPGSPMAARVRRACNRDE